MYISNIDFKSFNIMFFFAGLGVKALKSPSTPIECGVCDAVCSPRLTKQALRFGLICCDMCRKFISKMMLRARSSENSVPCEKGQGKSVQNF